MPNNKMKPDIWDKIESIFIELVNEEYKPNPMLKYGTNYCKGGSMPLKSIYGSEFKLTFSWEVEPIENYELKSLSLLSATNNSTGKPEKFDTSVHTFFHSAWDKMNDEEKQKQEELFSQIHDGKMIDMNMVGYKPYIDFNKEMITKYN